MLGTNITAFTFCAKLIYKVVTICGRYATPKFRASTIIMHPNGEQISRWELFLRGLGEKKFPGFSRMRRMD